MHCTILLVNYLSSRYNVDMFRSMYILYGLKLYFFYCSWFVLLVVSICTCSVDTIYRLSCLLYYQV